MADVMVWYAAWDAPDELSRTVGNSTLLRQNKLRPVRQKFPSLLPHRKKNASQYILQTRGALLKCGTFPAQQLRNSATSGAEIA